VLNGLIGSHAQRNVAERVQTVQTRQERVPTLSATKVRRYASGIQKRLGVDIGLPKNGAKRALRHITRMVWHGGVFVRSWAKPDLMTSGGLSVELEAAHFQLSRDLAVSESRKPAHSGRYNDCVIPAFRSGGESRYAVTITAGLDKLTCDVTGNVQRFGNCAALCNQAG
jgi:hypothetical protein